MNYQLLTENNRKFIEKNSEKIKKHLELADSQGLNDDILLFLLKKDCLDVEPETDTLLISENGKKLLEKIKEGDF